MKYRKLGRTGLDVSLICLGTMTWGVQNTEQDGHDQMNYALDQGVNFWDTAEMYAAPPGPETYGRTEEIIGSWFSKTGKRDQVILATKIAGSGLSWVRDGRGKIDPDNIIKAVEGSLKRLQTDYVDLYQLHWPNRGSYHFSQQWQYNPTHIDKAQEEENFVAVLQTFDNLVKEGKIRHIGLSNETAWGTMKYLQLAEKHGLPRMASIQNEYSLLRRVFEPDLAEIALIEDIGLLAWSPLATGILSGKYLNGARPEGSRWTLLSGIKRDTEASNEAARDYIEIAKKHDLDPCQMALAFVNSRSFVTANIIGATTMEQLKTNIDSIHLDLSDDILSEIDLVRRRYPMPY